MRPMTLNQWEDSAAAFMEGVSIDLRAEGLQYEDAVLRRVNSSLNVDWGVVHTSPRHRVRVFHKKESLEDEAGFQWGDRRLVTRQE